MLTEINGTIKIADDKIVLVIKKDDYKDDYEEFKKYKNVDKSGAIIDDKFYVGCTLNDQQLYITGSYPQEEPGDNTIMNVKSVGKKGGKYFSRLEEMKNLLGLNDGKEEIMVKALSCHPTVQLLEEKNVKTTELEAAEEQLKGKNEELEAAKKKAEEKQQELQTAKKEAEEKQQELEDKIKTLEDEKKKAEAEMTDLKAQPNTQEVANLQKQLQAKDQEIAQLKQQQPNAALLQEKEEKITELQAAKEKAEQKVKQLQQEKTDFETNNPGLANLQQQLKDKNEEITLLKQQQSNVEQLKKDLETQKAQVQQLQKKNKELEAASQGAQNKTIKQPEQSNVARYTAGVGVGLAAGLIAFTALERTVRLEMLVMIGIAVTSALVAGGITYAVLPSTQVDGVKAQEVNENGKSK